MTHAEIIYNIKNLISGGLQSDDEVLSDSQVAFIVNYYRARLFRQDIDRGRLNKEMYVQNLGRVQLTQADKNECCEADPCSIRTSEKLPQLIGAGNSMGITFVGTVDGVPFQKIFHNTIQWSKAAKWTAVEPKWYYSDGYIHLKELPTTLMAYVNIQGIFADPVKAEKYATCRCQEDGTCKDEYDYDYPIPPQHIDLILKMIGETELRILTGFAQDITNNSLDTLSEANENP